MRTGFCDPVEFLGNFCCNPRARTILESLPAWLTSLRSLFAARSAPFALQSGAPHDSWMSKFRRSGWTTLELGGSLPVMTIILILAVALVAGVLIRSRWALLLPLVVGTCIALAIVASGHRVGDTPIPFLVVVCTLVMVGGQGLRPRIVSLNS